MKEMKYVALLLSIAVLLIVVEILVVPVEHLRKLKDIEGIHTLSL